MIGLADWSPDIIAFIMCKIQNPFILDKIIKEIDNPLIKETAEFFLVRDEEGKPVGVRDKEFMTGANISVLISHDFMRAVENDEDWHLKFPDVENMTPEEKAYYDEHWENIGDVRKWEAMGLKTRVYHTLKARELWHLINVCARYSAEPGVIFIDECNEMSNSYYYPDHKGVLIVTNPCGEQPLPKFGVCNLGAVNLGLMYDPATNDINYELLRRVLHISQRFADNVIDASFYFLPENEKMAKAERRVGKGVMGLADLFIKMKIPYGSDEMLKKTDELFEFFATESYLASTEIAREKGSFEYFDCEKFLQSGYMKRMPKKVHDAIRKNGIRNSTSLTIAPTGSTGTLIGCGTGLEPYYSFSYFRSGRLGEFIEVKTEIAQKYFDEHPGETELPDYYVGAMDLSPLQHVRVQGTIQRWVDSAISKTCNAPKDFTVEQNKELYMEAWKLGCKGITVYVDGSRDSQVLSLTNEKNEFKEEAAKEIEIKDEDLMSDTRVCRILFDEQGNMTKECN
jgi:ribonucleoside-diphosphate reductase alpha chain